MLGRNFRAGEDTPHGREGRDPRLLDVAASATTATRTSSARRIRVNGVPYVDRRRHARRFRVSEQRQDLDSAADRSARDASAARANSSRSFGKLKPGVSLDQANVDVATIAKRLATDVQGDRTKASRRTSQPFTDNYIGKEPRQLLLTMLGAVFFVLLIACANVANLLLDRAAHRTKEVGIRTALGASRSAVIRQFLAESLVLSVAATVLRHRRRALRHRSCSTARSPPQTFRSSSTSGCIRRCCCSRSPSLR